MICDGCKRRYDVHAIVDSEVWERIAEGDYALCPRCMDERLQALGISAECDLQFVGQAMTSRRTERVERAGAWRLREQIPLESVGLPALYARRR
jgi:hypothetical protein